MASRRRLIDRLVDRGALQRWARLADRAEGMDRTDLRGARGRAMALRRHLDQVIRVADVRLSRPQDGPVAVSRGPGVDWAWRPAPWCEPVEGVARVAVASGTAFGAGMTVHHDCQRSEVTIRQVRHPEPAARSTFGVDLDVLGFDGTYLSLAIELPPEAAAGLRRHHLVGLRVAVTAEAPVSILARLNVRHGPNLVQVVRDLGAPGPEVAVEFDLAFSDLNETRVERSWIDLILAAPAMNRLALRDVTMFRRPRAAF